VWRSLGSLPSDLAPGPVEGRRRCMVSVWFSPPSRSADLRRTTRDRRWFQRRVRRLARLLRRLSARRRQRLARDVINAANCPTSHLAAASPSNYRLVGYSQEIIKLRRHLTLFSCSERRSECPPKTLFCAVNPAPRRPAFFSGRSTAGRPVSSTAATTASTYACEPPPIARTGMP
jgi:hypothetical protein